MLLVLILMFKNNIIKLQLQQGIAYSYPNPNSQFQQIQQF